MGSKHVLERSGAPWDQRFYVSGPDDWPVWGDFNAARLFDSRRDAMAKRDHVEHVSGLYSRAVSAEPFEEASR